jgi:hypothetical protein
MQLPEVGITCLFTFTTEFESLNGIYTVLTKQTFNNAIVTGVSFVDSLYTPAGLTQTNYNNDFSNYSPSMTVLQLQSVIDTTIVIFVPSVIISLTPDPTVQQYPTLAIAITLGTYDPASANISWIVDQLNQVAQSVTGTTNSVKLFQKNSTWLTAAQYASLDATRQAEIQSVETYYSALQSSLATIAQLRNLIIYYENGLKALAYQTGGATPPSG